MGETGPGVQRAMAKDREFVDWVLERLEPLGPLRSRAMFGGHGIWLEDPLAGEGSKGLFFALVAGGTLYVKADDANRAEFEEAGLEPFRPFPDRPVTMSYYPVPEDAMEDAEALLAWANRGVAAALRARGRSSGRV